MTTREQLIAAYTKLTEAAALLDLAGWPNLAADVTELANAVDVAIPLETGPTP